MKLRNLMSGVEQVLANEGYRKLAEGLVCKLIRVGVKIPSSEAVGALIADFFHTLETATPAGLNMPEGYLLGKVLDSLQDLMAICVTKERM